MSKTVWNHDFEIKSQIESWVWRLTTRLQKRLLEPKCQVATQQQAKGCSFRVNSLRSHWRENALLISTNR